MMKSKSSSVVINLANMLGLNSQTLRSRLYASEIDQKKYSTIESLLKVYVKAGYKVDDKVKQLVSERPNGGESAKSTTVLPIVTPLPTATPLSQPTLKLPHAVAEVECALRELRLALGVSPSDIREGPTHHISDKDFHIHRAILHLRRAF